MEEVVKTKWRKGSGNHTVPVLRDFVVLIEVSTIITDMTGGVVFLCPFKLPYLTRTKYALTSSQTDESRLWRARETKKGCLEERANRAAAFDILSYP